MLDDKTDLDALKARVAPYATLAEGDSEEEELVYNDEYDDTYDTTWSSTLLEPDAAEAALPHNPNLSHLLPSTRWQKSSDDEEADGAASSGVGRFQHSADSRRGRGGFPKRGKRGK